MKKFYFYRNLTRDTFSVKFGGKVISHGKRMLIGNDCGFKVNAGGRELVRSSGRKFVHAYVTADTGYTRDLENAIDDQLEKWAAKGGILREVRYNPHKDDTFVFADTGAEVHGRFMGVLLDYPKVFVLC